MRNRERQSRVERRRGEGQLDWASPCVARRGECSLWPTGRGDSARRAKPYQRQLAANRSQRGARPARKGAALLQGVVACGHGRTGVDVYYSNVETTGCRCRSRLDQTHTSGRRPVTAALVNPVIEARRLDIVGSEQITLAADAEELHQRAAVALRAFKQ